MAKKTPEPVEAGSSDLKPVRLLMPPDLHRLLRLLAADAGKSMATYSRDTLERLIRDEAKAKGIK